MKSKSKIPLHIATKFELEKKPALSPKTMETPLTRFEMDVEFYSVTKKFKIYARRDDEEVYVVEGYFVIGYYEDGYPGYLEIFAGKQGEETHGWVHSLSKSVTLCLQHGVPLDIIFEDLLYDEYEPKGISSVEEVPICKSVLDLVLRYMKANFPIETDGFEASGRYSGIIKAVVAK